MLSIILINRIFNLNESHFLQFFDKIFRQTKKIKSIPSMQNTDYEKYQ